MNIFSENFLQTIRTSIKICQVNHGTEILPRHLLLAMEKTKGCLAFDILAQCKPLIKQKVVVPIIKNGRLPEFSADAESIIQRAAKLAFEANHHYVGTEHLLSALLELPKEKIGAVKLPIEKIKKHLTSILNSNSHMPDFSKIFNNPEKIGNSQSSMHQPSALEHFTIDLTHPENQADINPVIGREDEIERIIQILCRKDKNNPVILGQAGVGKTALVEGLAQKISSQQVPALLMNKKILNLDMGLIVAGTMYRGEFENRLKSIMDQVGNDPNIILFIDELHNIIGAGSASGSMDAANLLKPLLARGKLRCIGATTPDEFKKHIEADPALERRFQPVHISEPNKEETLSILQGIKENYQNFHQVYFTDEALQAAVDLSVRYIQDKLLPDKAIDLIDEAAAKVKIRHQSKDPLLAEQLKLEKQINSIEEDKAQAILAEDYNLAVKLKQTQQGALSKLREVKKTRNQKNKKSKNQVTEDEILKLISQKTKIPMSELTESEYKRLSSIKVKLNKTIIGQQGQIEQIMKTISHAQLGLSDQTKPLASFLFLGSSGIGKTFTARELARHLFNNEEAFIQLDMSEFGDKFQATKLIGSPAGYVGYREGNKFTDLVKKTPHCLILLDEIEKAHPEILDLLLQILEHGHLTDSVGKKINFKNSIVIMTSNILGDKFSQKSIGFGSESIQKQDIELHLPELKKQFKPELINRINNLIIFNNLTQNDLQQVIKNQLKLLILKLDSKGIGVDISTSVTKFLAEKAGEQNAGARTAQNIIMKHIEQPLLDKLMNGQKKNFLVSKIKDKLIIK